MLSARARARARAQRPLFVATLATELAKIFTSVTDRQADISGRVMPSKSLMTGLVGMQRVSSCGSAIA